MFTYQYNIAGEILFIKAKNREDAMRQIFFGQLKKNGRVDLTKIDLKIVRDPNGGYVKRGTLRQAQCDKGNKIFDGLNHL